jgi:tRNA (guanine-N7-)-methyltransferase
MPGPDDRPSGGDVPRHHFHGRRKGRPLRPRRAGLVETLLPRLRVPEPVPGASIDPALLFDPPPDGVWLEIGFGGGEHLAAVAEANPRAGLIGAEPFLNGVASLLDLVDGRGLSNVRIHPDDVRPLLDALAPASLARCYVLYPDPWPKKRHAERRFVGRENLDRLARVLADGAELRMATDVPELAEWMAGHVRAHPDFDGPAGGPASWGERPDGWTPTRYEAKAVAAGRAPAYLAAVRRPRAPA